MLTNACTERSREGGRHSLKQGDALQIFMGNLVTAEMRDPPGRVANNVKSVVEHSLLNLKTGEMRGMPCKEVFSIKYRKGWLVLANTT